MFKKLTLLILSLCLLIGSTVASYIYGVTVGRELQHLNHEAQLAHELVWNFNFSFNEEVKPTKLQKEQDINEKIVIFGKYLTLKHYSPFFEDTFQSSAGLFKTVVEYRLKNPDYYIESGKPAPYSEQAYNQLEALFETSDFSDQQGKDFAQKQLAKYKQDSEYYHKALEHFN